MRFSVRRQLMVTVVAGLVLSIVAVAAPPAPGDELADKRAEAERISTRLSELETRMELLGEQYNQARLALERVQGDIDRAAKRLDAANTELARRRAELAEYAVTAYVDGGQSDLPDLLFKGTGSQVSHQIEYLQAAAANRRQMIDDVRAAQGRADGELADLQDDRDQAQALDDELGQKQADTERAAAEQQAILARVNGELGTLVAEAQARQAAADEQAARAQLASTAPRSPGSSTGPEPPSGPPASQPGPPTSPPTTRPGSPPTTAPPVTTPPVTRPPVTTPPPPTIPPGNAPPVLAIAAKAVALARTQLGVPYLWAGDNPQDGFDCSGLVMWAWRGAGRSLPHSSQLQYQVTRRLALSDLQPGDLLFYGSPIHHVGMYVGNGQMIEAPYTGSFVRYSSIYRRDLVGAGRVV